MAPEKPAHVTVATAVPSSNSVANGSQIKRETHHDAVVPDEAETDASGNPDQGKVAGQRSKSTFKPDLRFWAIMTALCVTSWLASLENTVIATSLPFIVTELGVGSNYVWIGNIFFLTSAAVQPLFGQLSNLFGRRHTTLFIVALFTLGSGICGGATNPAMLIAGRAIQGAGSGGVNMIIDVIISDLVPLRERGNYIAIVLLVYGVGTAIGPFLGGVIVETTTWRWVFYLNLPVGGLAMVMLWIFLRVKWNRSASFLERIRLIDYVGNAILIASTVAILLALTWAGVTYPWSSYQVLVPLLVGLAGLALFLWFEGSGIAPEPVMPLRLFANRASLIVYINTFLNSITLYWATFFCPLYFMAVQLSTPSWAGVQVLPLVLIGIPGAALSAAILSRWGRYKALHVAGFALVSLGFGLFGVLDRHSPTAMWACFEVVFAFGIGLLLNTILPAFQAGIDEKDQASATASWAFIRSFGSIWGVAVPAAIFNSYVARFADAKVSDASVREHLSTGDAYASATKMFVETHAEPLRSEILGVFEEALQKVFLIAIAFSGLALVLSLVEKEIKLRTELTTEFGLEEREQAKGDEEMGKVSA